MRTALILIMKMIIENAPSAEGYSLTQEGRTVGEETKPTSWGEQRLPQDTGASRWPPSSGLPKGIGVLIYYL